LLGIFLFLLGDFLDVETDAAAAIGMCSLRINPLQRQVILQVSPLGLLFIQYGTTHVQKESSE
jgi:hypothetical protein